VEVVVAAMAMATVGGGGGGKTNCVHMAREFTDLREENSKTRNVSQSMYIDIYYNIQMLIRLQ